MLSKKIIEQPPHYLFMQRNDCKQKFNYRVPYVPIMKADVSITKNLFIISIRQIISINDAIVMLNGAIV